MGKGGEPSGGSDYEWKCIENALPETDIAAKCHLAWATQPTFGVSQVFGADIQVAHGTPSLKAKYMLGRRGAMEGVYSVTENSHSAFKCGMRECETVILRSFSRLRL
jgi:hypothetical protein